MRSDRPTADLKPCPFCGSDSVVWSEEYRRVRCNSCFMGTTQRRGEPRADGEREKEIARWNRRALSSEAAPPWTDQELEAAAMRAAKELYPEGDGHWNRAAWLRVVLRELRASRGGDVQPPKMPAWMGFSFVADPRVPVGHFWIGTEAALHKFRPDEHGGFEQYDLVERADELPR